MSQAANLNTEQHAVMRLMETSVGSGLVLVMVESVVCNEAGICTKLAHCHILFSESAKAFAICVYSI